MASLSPVPIGRAFTTLQVAFGQTERSHQFKPIFTQSSHNFLLIRVTYVVENKAMADTYQNTVDDALEHAPTDDAAASWSEKIMNTNKPTVAKARG